MVEVSPRVSFSGLEQSTVRGWGILMLSGVFHRYYLDTLGGWHIEFFHRLANFLSYYVSIINRDVLQCSAIYVTFISPVVSMAFDITNEGCLYLVQPAHFDCLNLLP